MITVRVAEIAEEADGIKSFRLEPCEPGGRLAGYEAGAHIDVTGPTGITRQYSLCGADPGSYLIAVKLEENSRGGSAALHSKVFVGDELRISPPRNLFALGKAAKHVLLAGGIGVTPLLGMAYQLTREGKDFTLDYFARSPQYAAFTGILGEKFAEQVTFHYGLSVPDQENTLTAILGGLDADSHVYVCGPAPFMTQVTTLAAAVLTPEQIHLEHFAAPEPETTESGAFEVEIDTGEVFTVPADRSIAEVLEDGGVPIDTSCREGICGTCIATVREGVPDHRDHCLTAKEKAAGDQIALCVSRSRSGRLVIEL
ncbi:PDR/VanB family oxidoreductase [Amycolatopsis jejuensis]|uniref:PDR/VanB family oxidoreductase n=1 Tax=Amycolatopsis jejuensis TaxID=330084 RepID=UPI000526FE94|nr:PDR/VanB family oxidoreductase [Amycolatopsis jejuensis]